MPFDVTRRDRFLVDLVLEASGCRRVEDVRALSLIDKGLGDQEISSILGIVPQLESGSFRYIPEVATPRSEAYVSHRPAASIRSKR